MECILSGVQSSSYALYVSSSAMYFFSVLIDNILHNIPVYHILRISSLLRHSCASWTNCVLHICYSPVFWLSAFFRFFLYYGCVFASPHVDCFSSSVSEGFIQVFILLLVYASVIASTDMSFFRILLSSYSPVDFPMSDRILEAKSSAAIVVSNFQFFSTSRLFS